MTPQIFTDGRFGPQIDLDDFRLPPHVGARLAALFGHETPITSGAEWVDEMRSTLETQQGRTPTEADLCHAEDGAHSVETGDDRLSFVCVLDPLIVPFLRDEPARIESVTPQDEERVVIDIDTDGMTVSPDSAVVSLGVSDHVDEETTPSLETVYRQVCGYIHVFATVDEYERWADDVDAATTSLPAETGVAVARELATALFDA